MGLLAHGSDNAGGAIAGRTGSESSGAGGGVGGIARAGAGGFGVSNGGAGGGTSGVCGEAICLTSLFQTCVPEGSCSWHGGGSPSASFSDVCYSNGVTVSYFGTYKYGASNVTASLTVARNGTLCYKIDTLSGGDFSYVITDGNGQQVATGTADNKAGDITVTCNGSKPTTVSYACINPTGDSSGCDTGTCP